MRVTHGMMAAMLQRNISRNAEYLDMLREQVASGKRLRLPSDDPQLLAEALAMRATSDQNAQYLRNLGSARSWLGATAAALDRVSTALIRARDLALRGATGSLGVEERKALGNEVDALLGEVLDAANSTEDGRYLFAGHQVKTAPFAADGSFTEAPAGPVGDMKREIRHGVEMVVNLRGNHVVDGQMPLQQALTALNGLRDQLSAGADPSAYVPQLVDSLSGVVDMSGIVAARMNRLDATEQQLNQEQVGVAARLSQAENADVYETMSKLMMQETVYQAALQAGARALQPSLLDFLR